MLRGGPTNPVVFAMSTTYLLLIIGLLLGITYGVVRFVTRNARSRMPRLGRGFKPLLPEMTYTATGFSNPVRVIFDAIFNPTELENERKTIHEHFRSAIRRKREDVFLPTASSPNRCPAQLGVSRHFSLGCTTVGSLLM